jgi:DNA-directed RNA polymerase subunit RPC12/RpoP
MIDPMIEFACPECDEEMEIADRKAGETIRCVNCECKILVPAADDNDDTPRPKKRRRRERDDDDDDRRRDDHIKLSKSDCHQLAMMQKGIFVCILLYLLAIPLPFVIPQEYRMIPIGYALVVSLIGTVLVWAMAIKVFGGGVGTLFGLMSLIPCVGIIMLLVINGKATAVLQNHGYTVGFLGVPMSELR